MYRALAEAIRDAEHQGISLAKLGKIDDAIVHFQEMLRLSPGDARALKNIEFALEMRSRGNPSGNP